MTLKTVNLITFNTGPLVRAKPIATKPKIYNSKIFDSRSYQIKAIKKLKNENHIIFNAPTGSGKSYVITQLYNHELNKDKGRKIIIAVPQTVIAKSFVQDPNSYLSECGMNNLCSDNKARNIAELIRFIEEKAPPTNSDRVRICTHATLVGAFDKIDKNKIKDISIWIDEGHHVKNSEIKLDDIAIYEANKLGQLVQYIVKNRKLNSSIKLSTATFFRGDTRSIVSKSIEDKFIKFQVPYDEYLAVLDHLESFSYDVVLYNGSYLDAIRKLKKQYGKHIVVYIPNVNSPHIVCDKYTDSKAIINTISGGEWIDAVDESRRNFKKSRLMEENLDVRGITFLGMGKEGFDWARADTSLILGERNSLTEVIQIIGRLLRDYPDKKHVKILHFLPFTFDKLNKEKFKDSVNNYLKVIYSSMLFEDIFNPIKLRFTTSKSNKEPAKSAPNKLNIVFEDPNDRIAFEEAVIKNFSARAEHADIFRTEFNDVVSEELTKAGKTKWHKEIANQLWQRYSRKSLLMRGYDASKIDIDLINKVENPFDWLLKYISEAGLETFDKLRGVINNNYTIQDMQKLAEERGGKCLSDKFVNMNARLSWECSVGHIWESIPSIIVYRNSWCSRCSGKRKTIDDMYNLAEKRGGKCLSKNYVNSSTKLEWKCSDNHQWEATPDSIRDGAWCPHCSGRRKTIKDMFELAANNNGKCLSEKYINDNVKLKWKCKNNHVWETRPSSIIQGHWCSICGGNNKKTINDMVSLAAKHNGECLSNKYINSHTKLKWICNKGHIFEAMPAKIVSGQWCRKCGREKVAGLFKLKYSEISKLAKKNMGKCLTKKYKNAKTKMLWQCNAGHKWFATYDSVRMGRWCIKCNLDRKRKIKKIEIDKILLYYNKNGRAATIAKFNIGNTTLYRYLNKA